jgi:hypothetical protein
MAMSPESGSKVPIHGLYQCMTDGKVSTLAAKARFPHFFSRYIIWLPKTVVHSCSIEILVENLIFPSRDTGVYLESLEPYLRFTVSG